MKAVILAAGQGTRLRPLTDSLPKCLVPVNGVPILQYQLQALEQVGIRECAIVVGYLKEQIEQHFGSKFRSISLDYIFNEHFAETNNIYSLWAARDHLRDDIILVEGDILFDQNIFGGVPQTPRILNIAIVARFQAGMNGTVIIPENNIAKTMVLKSQQSNSFPYDTALKTVNIYIFSQATMTNSLLPTIENWVIDGRTDQFYEAAIAQLIESGDLELEFRLAADNHWFEIDTVEDLESAKSFIPSPSIDTAR